MAAALRLAAAGLLLASCAGAGQAPSASAAGDELVVRTARDIQVRDAKGDLLRSFGRPVAAPDGSRYYAFDGASPPALQLIAAKTGRTSTRVKPPGTFRFPDEPGPAPSRRS